MNILWVCNVLPQIVAEKLNMQGSNKEGWIGGTLSRLISEAKSKDVRDFFITLSLAFPVDSPSKEQEHIVKLSDSFSVTCFGYYERTDEPQNYCLSLENRFKAVIDRAKPDIVHVFGTEYGHTLGMAKAIKSLKDAEENLVAEKMKNVPELLIGIQGVISKCGEEYAADLPEAAINGITFRDLIKRDNIARQQAKFLERGEMEKEALSISANVTGRTNFDKAFVKKIKPDIKYYFMNETLREPFYSGEWELEKCRRHTIFMSQGDYPLKGLHILIEAMAKITESFNDAVVYVAGADITAYSLVKEKLKIGSYGRYLRNLIKALKLEGKIIFTGRLNELQMKEMYLKCHTYVCASSLENSPNSMGEAMLLGVPVTASRVGGIPSLIDEDREGLLFEAGNAEGLADNIIRIWNDDTYAKELGNMAKKRAAITHNRDVNYNRLIEIYSDLIKEKL